MSNMNKLDLKKLRRVASEATRDLWTADIVYDDLGHAFAAGPHLNIHRGEDEGEVERDVAYIAAFSPQTALALLDLIEKLQEKQK